MNDADGFLNLLFVIGLFGFFAITVSQCSDNFTVMQYSGFAAECERQGGIAYKETCFHGAILEDILENHVNDQ